MMKCCVLLLALVGIATALQCNSCDSFLSCSRPFPVNCPPHSRCYTLTRNGEIVAKGCAHSCQAISYLDGSNCQECHHQDFCNDFQPAIGQGAVMRQQPEIGGGVAPNNNNGYHIGHGVRPRSATQASFGVLMALPVVRRFL